MSPIVTHEDDKALANLERDESGMLKSIAGTDSKIFSTLAKLGDVYNKSMQEKERYLRKKRDVSKQMEILAREDRSEITKEEVDSYKDQINEEADLIEKQRLFLDALKDLGIQGEALVAKKKDYADAISEMAKQRMKVVGISVKLEKAKNTMQVAEKLQAIEDALKDEERNYERVKRDLEKKYDALIQERDEINKLWSKLKDSIQEFQF